MNIDKATSNFINNMKHQRNILKARETKVSLIALRKQWLDKQKRDNYQLEYDRIRGLLESSVLKGTSALHIKKRIDTLKGMDVGMKPNKMFDNLY